MRTTSPRRNPSSVGALALVLGGALLANGCVGSALRANTKGSETAREALLCESLETAFPVPARYATAKAGYKGCGKFALVRCVTSVSTSTAQCEAVEVVSEAEASQTGDLE